MRRKIMLMLVALMLVFSVTACNKQADSSTVNESVMEQDVSQAEKRTEGFDMERIRKSVMIKGQSFEMPTALDKLSQEWTWEHDDYLSDDGNGLVNVYYNEEEWFVATVENYFEGSEDEGIIYNLTIETADSSIDGFVPLKSTKQEILEKYGEPVEISERNGEFFYGGIYHRTFLEVNKKQGLAVMFDENDIVTSISITYYVDVKN